MTFNNYYEIELNIKGKSIKLSPVDYSFVLEDSIHSFFNWATFNIKDLTGIIQESLITAKGYKITLGYGIKDDTINKCEFTIDYDKITEPTQKGLLSGDLEINLINSWYDNQTIKSAAYKNKISNIVQQLISPHFKKFNIDITGNDDIWYQPLITDSFFIEKILLPNAYSNNSNDSPFFSFITSDNTFYFKNYNSMIKRTPVASLKYVAEGVEGSFSNSNIMRTRRWREKNDILKKYLHRKIYKINNSGELIEEDDYIFNYPLGSIGTVPMIGNRNLITSMMNLGYSKNTLGGKQNLLGQKINSMRDTLFIDRFILTLPFSPKLLSGKVIDIDFYTINQSSGDVQKLSSTFSGKYIIENSRHIWSGERREGFTTIIIGRKFVDLSSAYIIKSEFIQ